MLRWCCDDVATSLRKRGFLARKVMVKLRFPDLSYATKGRTLDCPTDAASVLYPQCVDLLLAMMGMVPESVHAISLARPVRLAGMSTSGLVLAEETAIQPSLDDLLEENEAERHAAVQAKPAQMQTHAKTFAWCGSGTGCGASKIRQRHRQFRSVETVVRPLFLN